MPDQASAGTSACSADRRRRTTARRTRFAWHTASARDAARRACQAASRSTSSASARRCSATTRPTRGCFSPTARTSRCSRTDDRRDAGTNFAIDVATSRSISTRPIRRSSPAAGSRSSATTSGTPALVAARLRRALSKSSTVSYPSVAHDSACQRQGHPRRARHRRAPRLSSALRDTLVLAQSEELPLAERPLRSPLYGDRSRWRRVVPDLAPGAAARGHAAAGSAFASARRRRQLTLRRSPTARGRSRRATASRSSRRRRSRTAGRPERHRQR